MLINLGSRRRAPYGTYLCAAVSSFLLLLSVSFLYISLSHSHPHFHTHLYHRNNRPSVNFDSLLSDSDDNKISGTEDMIDALDVIEEQQDEEEELRNIEMEEEDEVFDQIKVSGHLFDHVSGAIRRAYDQRSMEAWDDDSRAGFFMGAGGVEDRSKAAFGSDDVPVDDLVRRKAIQVMGIEDALLLKVGKRVSPLREGWGDWFDKKADFLRKDKMLKSNSEGLNPLHNPILQDPDGVGVTGLTKCDRVFQKLLINDFKEVPFPFLGSTKSSKLQGNEAKVKECDSKAKAGGKMLAEDDTDLGKCNPEIACKAQEHP